MSSSLQRLSKLVVAPGSRRTLAALDIIWILLAFFLSLPQVQPLIAVPHVATTSIALLGCFVFALVCRSYTESVGAPVSGSLKIALACCLFAATKLVTDDNPVAVIIGFGWAALLAICLVFGVQNDGRCNTVLFRVVLRTMLTTLVFVLTSFVIVLIVYWAFPSEFWTKRTPMKGDIAIVKPFGAAVPLCALPPIWLELRRLERMTSVSRRGALNWAVAFSVLLWFTAGWFGIGADVIRRTDIADPTRSLYFTVASGLFGVAFAAMFTATAIVLSDRRVSVMQRILFVVMACCVTTFVVAAFSDFVFIRVDSLWWLASVYGVFLLNYIGALYLSRRFFARLMRSLDLMRHPHEVANA